MDDPRGSEMSSDSVLFGANVHVIPCQTGDLFVCRSPGRRSQRETAVGALMKRCCDQRVTVGPFLKSSADRTRPLSVE